MKKIGGMLFNAAQFLFDHLFDWLCSLTEDDEEDADWPVAPKAAATCHVCSGEAPGHHPKGEFVVCDNCRQPKPST